ncbi:cytochrome P450 [Tribonema minus]|uniref:Cytochrome P450 n=1 Tax=Tribonema minus TaxID=303371 RepID=A0A835YS73_9STRA|nr:cytochrome P450 [Tribonema minus]
MLARDVGSAVLLLAALLLTECYAFRASYQAPLSRRFSITLPAVQERGSSAVADRPPSDLQPSAPPLDEWEGQKYGFDWQLERARRAMVDSSHSKAPPRQGFAPFRMTPWQPAPPEQEPDILPPPSAWDSLYIIASNVAQKYFGAPSLDGAPVASVGTFTGSWSTFLQKVASGRLEDLAGGPLFLLLEKYPHQYGPVYKLAFGPRSFIVISDPVAAKHILKTNAVAYDKGMLATILEPIMGKGLIPADPQTWKVRRRAIVPGFHKRWLNRMVRLFAECNEALLDEVGRAADEGRVLDMEEKFCSVSLDIIGRAVFNYDFGSTTNESPVIKAVYRVLREAEHRSASFIPYWKLPFASRLLPSQAEFKHDLKLLNDVLDELIAKAAETQEVADIAELEGRDLDKADDSSLLRFLIDMRGEDTTSKQLRDDLMTMLVAGHETTAAVLTWTLFNLAQDAARAARVREEIATVLGPRRAPSFDDIPKLKLTRLGLAEALRLSPSRPVRLVRGADVFISTWNLHRSPALWQEPAKYDPERFLRPHSNPGVTGWAGFDPRVGLAGLYPSEIASDFAFLPFGGGQRKCVGDQFALMEATVTLALLLHDFDLALAGAPRETRMVTGATIHTADGLRMTARRRRGSGSSGGGGGGGSSGGAGGEDGLPRGSEHGGDGSCSLSGGGRGGGSGGDGGGGGSAAGGGCPF